MDEPVLDYSNYILQGQALLRQISEHATRNQFQHALVKTIELGDCQLNLFRALRKAEGEYYDREQAIRVELLKKELK